MPVPVGVDGTKPSIKLRKRRSLRDRSGLISYASDNTSQGGEDGIIAKLFELLPCASPEGGDSGTCSRWLVDVGAWDGVHWSNTHSLLVKDQQPRQLEHPSPRLWRGVLIEADPVRFVSVSGPETPSRLRGLKCAPPLYRHRICRGRDFYLLLTIHTLPFGTPSFGALSRPCLGVGQRFDELERLHAERDDCICVCKAVSCIDGHPSSLPALLSAAAPRMPADFDFITIDIDGADYWLMAALLDGGYRPKVR